MSIPLMMHQVEGIKFLLENKRVLLCDEAGLGKSRQVLEAAKECVKYRNMLVLCPTSLVENWKEEALKWGFPMHKLFVAGYEYQFLHHYNQLKAKSFGVIVADEAHNLRNWTAQRTKLFKDLIKGRDSKIWMLTGTPVVKGAQDMHSLLSFAMPGEIGKYKEYVEKFCRKKPNQWKPGGVEYYGVQNGTVLNKLVQKVMIRRYKKDVLNDLPPKMISKVPLDCGTGSFDIFTAEGIVRAVSQAVESGGGVVSEELASTRQELGLKKVPHVVQFICDAVHPHPTVIFAHHRLVVYEIAEKLRDKGRRVGVLIGGMDKLVRQGEVNKFQDGEYDDIVCSINVAGIGINLFRSSRCVFAEFPWTWAELDQASDRLHRIGQYSSVNIYNCVAKGTFEESQLRLIEDRKLTMKEIVGV